MMAAESMLVAVRRLHLHRRHQRADAEDVDQARDVVRQDVQRCFEMRRLRLKNLSDHDIS